MNNEYVYDSQQLHGYKCSAVWGNVTVTYALKVINHGLIQLYTCSDSIVCECVQKGIQPPGTLHWMDKIEEDECLDSNVWWTLKNEWHRSIPYLHRVTALLDYQKVLTVMFPKWKPVSIQHCPMLCVWTICNKMWLREMNCCIMSSWCLHYNLKTKCLSQHLKHSSSLS